MFCVATGPRAANTRGITAPYGHQSHAEQHAQHLLRDFCSLVYPARKSDPDFAQIPCSFSWLRHPAGTTAGGAELEGLTEAAVTRAC